MKPRVLCVVRCVLQGAAWPDFRQVVDGGVSVERDRVVLFADQRSPNAAPVFPAIDRHRSLERVDRVVWECPVHGVVDEWPDDGSPESMGATSPHFPVCPGPWDDERNDWTYKCERKLRRRVHTD
jgi:hypothetical protein